MEEFGEFQKRVERGGWIKTSPAWVDMPAQKNYGQRRLENSGGVGRRISGGENLGQQQNVEDERNPYVDSCLRVMKIFREFLCETKRDGITCPEGADGR